MTLVDCRSLVGHSSLSSCCCNDFVACPRIREEDPEAQAGSYARFYAPASYLRTYKLQIGLPIATVQGICIGIRNLYNTSTAGNFCPAGTELRRSYNFVNSCQLSGLSCPQASS